MKTQEQTLTKDLRSILKAFFESELQEVPNLLNQLEPNDRLNFIIKMMPYVFPKVESVHLKEGEPFSLD